VLAVPGSIRSPQSAGTNLLIRDGARPFLDLTDLAESVPELAGVLPLRPETRRSPTGLSGELREILGRMGAAPVHPDELAETLGLSAQALAVRLCELEVRGAVLSMPGGLVARTV
jgi:DNA processing protein